MILFMAALSNIPKELIRQRSWTVRRAAISSSHQAAISPRQILFVTILSIINSFKIFREIYLLTGDYLMMGCICSSIS